MYHGDAGQEESFSFNCNDLINYSNSHMGVLVSDNEDDDDDESYIEIAIEPTSTNEYEYDDEEEDALEFQFRISFSSVPSFPPLLSSQCLPRTNNLLPCKIPETDYSPSYSPSLSSSTSSFASNLITSSSTTTSMYSEWDCASQKPNPPAPSNVQKPLESGLKESWEIGDTKGRFYEYPQSTIHPSKSNWNLIQSRKTSKVVTAINGGIMKFFIKFRSVKLQSILSLVKKSQKVIVGQDKSSNNSTGICQRDQKQRSDKIIKNYFGIGERSRATEINLDAIKGIIQAMGVSIGRRKDRQPKRKSCPSSIKSSPIHQGSVPVDDSKIYSRDNSIQAAISHCKRSNGLTPDYCAQGLPKA